MVDKKARALSEAETSGRIQSDHTELNVREREAEGEGEGRRVQVQQPGDPKVQREGNQKGWIT